MRLVGCKHGVFPFLQDSSSRPQFPHQNDMNEWDRDNLNFIMNISEDGFDEWLDQADDDDVDYALSLIRIAKSELLVEELNIMDDVEDTAVAKAILDRIRNGKI